MTDEELRQLVRESIARHAGGDLERPRVLDTAHIHASHATFALRSGDEDGACVIEPTVRCNRCGYCLSYGH
jgi:hypothetical protein